MNNPQYFTKFWVTYFFDSPFITMLNVIVNYHWTICRFRTQSNPFYFMIGLYQGGCGKRGVWACESTIIAPDIDIDVETLQNFVLLRCFWYCTRLFSILIIGIRIASSNQQVSILIAKQSKQGHPLSTNYFGYPPTSKKVCTIWPYPLVRFSTILADPLPPLTRTYYLDVPLKE